MLIATIVKSVRIVVNVGVAGVVRYGEERPQDNHLKSGNESSAGGNLVHVIRLLNRLFSLNHGSGSISSGREFKCFLKDTSACV
mgnify:FL=1